MSVKAVNISNKYPQMRNNTNGANKVKSAKNGALAASSVLCTSAGLSWLTRKPAMQEVVKNCGGKRNYAANFAFGLGLFSAGGAALNTVLHSVTDKISHKQSPKAVN